MLFNFALEQAIRKVQENKKGMQLNGTHQLLVYVDDVTLLSENVDIIKKSIEAVLYASKDAGLDGNTEKTKCMFMSHHQTVGQNHYIQVPNK
jgi:hypothetical protein